MKMTCFRFLSQEKDYSCWKGADNIGMQSGGWTISWQGEMGNTTDGTTILEAIRSAVNDETSVEYSVDGKGVTGDVAVV